MIVYQGKEYSKSADVIRELYDLGQISLNSDDKKRIAGELGIAPQSVHAVLKRHIGGASVKTRETKSKKVSVSETQIKNKINQKIAKVKSGKGPIVINDKSDEVKEELMKDKKKIAVTWAPNQWGLPITNPPMYIIDENYDPNWMPPPEEEVERNWE